MKQFGRHKVLLRTLLSRLLNGCFQRRLHTNILYLFLVSLLELLDWCSEMIEAADGWYWAM
jgi:hypothetical protein